MAGERLSEYMDFYYRYSERDARQDYLRGKDDGLKNLPRTEDINRSLHEQRFEVDAEAAQQAYQKALNSEVQSVSAKVERRLIERDTDYRHQQEAEASGLRLTEESDLGFPMSSAFASLAHAHRNIDHARLC
jgi:hypothetical protein